MARNRRMKRCTPAASGECGELATREDRWQTSDGKSDELKACDAYHLARGVAVAAAAAPIWTTAGRKKDDQRVPPLGFKWQQQLNFFAFHHHHQQRRRRRQQSQHLMTQFDTLTTDARPDVAQEQNNKIIMGDAFGRRRRRRALYSISCNRLDYLYCYCCPRAIDRPQAVDLELLDELYCYCPHFRLNYAKRRASERQEQSAVKGQANGAMINKQEEKLCVHSSDNVKVALQIHRRRRRHIAKKSYSLACNGKRWWPLHSSSVTWATTTLALIVSLAMLTTNTANADSKSTFWRSLVNPLYSSGGGGGGGGGGGESGGVGGEGVDQLVRQLSEWPDQKRAALFYMDQLGGKLEDLAARAKQRTPSAATSSAFCRHVSFAELMAPTTSEYFIDAHNNDDDDYLSARRVALDQLIHEEDSHKRRLAKHHLIGDRRLAAVAQLALDNANLVSRLLAPAVRANGDERDEQDDDLELGDDDNETTNKRRNGNDDDDDDEDQEDNSNFFKRIFGLGGADSSDQQKRDKRHTTSGEELKLTLNKLVTVKFLRYLLTTKLRNHQEVGSPEVAKTIIHSLGLILFQDDNDDDLSQVANVTRRIVKFAGQALPGGRFVNLGRARNATNAELRYERLPSFVAKWMLPGGNRKFAVANQRRKSNKFATAELQLADGHWFSPHFECSISNRWLFTYSVPLVVASHNDNKNSIRGVSFVSLDLARTNGGSLVDQCAHLNSSWSFLAATNLCHERLLGSQCAPLLPAAHSNGAGPVVHFRPGAYACQCPRAWPHLSAPPRGVGGGGGEFELADEFEQRRAQLLKLMPGQLATQIATLAGEFEPIQVNNYNNNNNHTFHLLGRALEWDATLDWLATGNQSSSWPPLGCRLCNSPDCPSSLQPEVDNASEQSLAWVRPLVLSLQIGCMLSTLALIGVVLRVRKSRLIIASGWLMLETMLIGALLLYTSVLVRYFQPTSLTCLLEPWFRELGFSIFFSSILIKLYRILTEFQTRKAHRVCLRDKDQVIYLLAVVFIVIGYMSAWTALMVDGFFVSRASETQSEVNFQVSSSSSSSSSLSSSSDRMATAAHNTSWRRSLVSSGADELPTATTSSSSTRDIVNEHLEILARGLDSFGELFLGLLESVQSFDSARHSPPLVFVIRCRKLTWDYVTESSELALLLFGLHLVYKLRNASREVHKEKLILSLAVFVELIVSSIVYTIRHSLWHHLNQDHLLLAYALRCQLSVTSTIILIFGPKLWEINKNKPGLLWGSRFFGSGDNILTPGGGGANAGGGGGATNAAGGQCGGGVGGGASGNSSGSNSKRMGSQRHRCHISCEVHDHHLNDRTRLQQAMLTNSALEIGSINLADMDPDEIQAELKRVYTQLEMLKTKVMRRDNPHISKRRGGRKPGHRKFSLQAFHNRHSGSAEHTTGPSAASTATSQQANDCTISSSEQVSLLTVNPTNGSGIQRHQVYHQTGGCGANRLPALAELDSENSSATVGDRSPMNAAYLRTSQGGVNSTTSSMGGSGGGGGGGKHVRVDDTILEYHDDHMGADDVATNNRNNNKFGASNLTSKLLGRSNKKNKLQLNQQTQHKNNKSKWTPDLPSTSSLGLDEEAMMALNDSQSSGEITPQHRSSIVYGGHSSSQANEPSSSIG